ncbi:ABC transporter permease [Microbacterium excoecariae]|uniref:ABC transporter permease n=1 Tax=Microbacterium excoecariae TaxID=2715210 RepID=UPI00140DDDB9|nr:ABC transporter permease [Microbacterium excoecariae]NHI17214.1 ABC transporter permease [Microbacterium excoecariae]
MTAPRRIAGVVAGRVGSALLVVWVVATVVFFALRATGDPLEAILGGPGSQAGPDAVRAATERYGLDEPLWTQYLMQLRDVATLNLGDSYARRVPVADLILENLGPTLVLAALSFTLAWILTLAGSFVRAFSRGPAGRAAQAALSGLEVIAAVTPQFWLGAVLIMVFATSLGWLPATSAGGGAAALVLPVVTLAVPIAGFLAQVTSDALADADAAPFATSARARGAGEARVLLAHTLRHAALPGLALSGWALGSLLSGAVVVEVLFARPGLGRLLQEAALQRDVPVVIGTVIVVALVYVVVVTVTDLAEAWLDPRLGGRHAPTPEVAAGVGQ